MSLPSGSRSQSFEPSAPRALGPGDIVPPLGFRRPDGKPIALNSDDIAGNYIVLLLCPTLAGGIAGELLRRFEAIGGRIKAAGILLYAVTPQTAGDDGSLAAGLGFSFPILSDPGGRSLELFGVLGQTADPDASLAVLIRPNRHVMGCYRGSAGDPAAAVLAAVAADAGNRRAVPTPRHPPALMVPDVLSRKDCEELIGVFLLQGNVWVEPGHGSRNMQSDYKMRIPDYGRRDRVDHWVINKSTAQFIYDRLSRRVFPEIEKAFQYRVTRFERFRIGCYHGERGGESHGHRDNSQPAAAYRRFACSINLNTEQFEGGELRFPEYGGHLYRPETGTAIVFSSSLLHEPLHVTTGTRYVLLAFLYGET